MGEIETTFTVNVSATITIKRILADTPPETPTGYTPFPAGDIDLGQLGILYAFKKD